MSPGGSELDFVVGTEKRLDQVLTAGEVLPLLEAACQSGVVHAEIVGCGGDCLWQARSADPGLTRLAATVTPAQCQARLLLEAEPVGVVRLYGLPSDAARLEVIVQVLGSALNQMLFSNLKRMLTTEIHTLVVNQSWEDLLASHERLQASETKYRELAASLETRVQEKSAELQQAYLGLLQQEKMASIGQLAAGIAHEINNPLGFILSNLRSLESYVGRFTDLLGLYRQGLALHYPESELQRSGEALCRQHKLDVIWADLDDLFAETVLGAERVRKIVADLKAFSHIDALTSEELSLHEEIDRVLNVLGHETPPGTRVECRFAGSLPRFCGRGDQLGQVLLNLLRNALQSRDDGLVVEVVTACSDGWLELTIDDNGPGIPAEQRQKVFEPFFTTRRVGSGTGLGLTVVYNTLCQWGGEVVIGESAAGGARVQVRWPLQGAGHG